MIYITEKDIKSLLLSEEDKTIDLNNGYSISTVTEYGFKHFEITAKATGEKWFQFMDYQYDAMFAPNIFEFIYGLVVNINYQINQSYGNDSICEDVEELSRIDNKERVVNTRTHFYEGNFGEFLSRSGNDMFKIQKMLDVSFSNIVRFVPYRLLLQRGWNDEVIEKMGLLPDEKSCTDFMSIYGESVEVYSMEEVLRLEQTDDFREAIHDAETKRNEKLEMISNMRIVMPSGVREDIFEKAVRYYNKQYATIGRFLEGYDSLEEEVIENVVCEFVKGQSRKVYEDVLSDVDEKDYLFRRKVRECIYDRIKEVVHETFFNQAA